MSSLERYGGRTTTLGIYVLLGITGFFLLTEHQAHLFGVLPWLFLLACPVMHLLMHRGHRHAHGTSERGSRSRAGCHGSGAQTESPAPATEAHASQGGVS